MTARITMTTTQQVAYGISPKDRQGNAITSVPSGDKVTFVSGDPTVAEVKARAGDPFNVDVGTPGKVGATTVTVSWTKADGSVWRSDTLEVTVTDGVPDSLNATVGEPSEEP